MTIQVSPLILVVLFLIGWGIGLFMGLLVSDDPSEHERPNVFNPQKD